MATKEKKTTTREEAQEQSTGTLSEVTEGPKLEEEVYSAEALTEYADREVEEADEAEDHAPVSSMETGEVEETADVEAPSVGENGSLAKGNGAGDEAELMQAAPDLESELEILEGFDPSILEMTEADLMERADENQLLDAYHLEFGDPVVNELLRRQPETNAQGQYRLGDLLPGEYEIRVEAADRPPQTKTAQVKAGSVTQLDFSLPGG